MEIKLNRVEGVEELTGALNKLIMGEADKQVKLAMQDAAKESVKTLKAAMPKKMFKKLVRYKFKQGKKLMFMRVGLADKKKTLPQMGYSNTKGNNKYVWSVAYWLNYGTLNRRDPVHKFAEAIKGKSIGKTTGVRPQHFFDNAEPHVTATYKAAFSSALDRRIKNIYNK